MVRRRFRHRCGWPVAAAAFGCAIIVSAHAVAEPVDFSRDIQPLLAKRCFSCHGPDTHEAGLRFDQADAATAKLESGTRAIVAGRPSESEILARITSTDPAIQMPPEGPRLTSTQVAVVRKWIEEGAEWKEHWAFRPLVRPDVPAATPGADPPPAPRHGATCRRESREPPAPWVAAR